MTELLAVAVIVLMGLAGILSIFGKEAAHDGAVQEPESKPRRQVA